jgi:hypothetical protein
LLKERNSLLKKLSEACTCDVAKLICDACNCLVSVAKEKESEGTELKGVPTLHLPKDADEVELWKLSFAQPNLEIE